METPLESQYDVRMSGELLLIRICNFHVLSNLLLIYTCKLHWNLNTMFECQGDLLLIYIYNFHVLNHLPLIYICKLHWNLSSRLGAEKSDLFYCHRSFLVVILDSEHTEPVTTCTRKTCVTSSSSSSCDGAVISCAGCLFFLCERLGSDSQGGGLGNFFLIYICNSHVLTHLLLIYICKLHWNLNTMFVCQVNSL